MSMNGSGLSDIITLANALTAKKEGDRAFQDTLNELSATMAELKEFFEKYETPGKDDGAMQEIVSSMREAVSALSSMKPPNVTVQAPSQKGWSKLKVSFDTTPNGFIKGATIERA